MQLMTEKKEIIRTRIEKIVKELMQSEDWFQKYIVTEEIINELLNSVQKFLTEEQFNQRTDDELRESFRAIMSSIAMAESFKELTPEQVAIFDEAIKRK